MPGTSTEFSSTSKKLSFFFFKSDGCPLCINLTQSNVNEFLTTGVLVLLSFILRVALLFTAGDTHSDTTDDAVLASEKLFRLLLTPIIVFSLLFSLLLKFSNILTFSSMFLIVSFLASCCLLLHFNVDLLLIPKLFLSVSSLFVTLRHCSLFHNFSFS